MDTVFERNGNKLICHLIGELDECAAKRARAELDKQIMRDGYTTFVFDLSSITFLDSTGVGLLLGRYKLLESRGKKCCLARPSSQVKKVLIACGINALMEII